MKKIILIIIVLMGWYGNYKYKQGQLVAAPTESSIENNEPTETLVNSNYKCDGRTRCPQMTSCEEATFFINNCPNTKMDGDNDGIPCESQWCQ
jgi:hypothetical protein